MIDTFECSECHKTFDKNIPMVEAWTEYLKEYPLAKIDDMQIVCDSCFKEHEKLKKRQARRKRKALFAKEANDANKT